MALNTGLNGRVSKKPTPPTGCVHAIAVGRTESVVVSEGEIGPAETTAHPKAVPAELVAAAVLRQATRRSRSCKER